MFFSDLHVQILARGILEPEEQLVGQTVTSYMPWWAFGFIRRQYLVLATDRRLVLVDHRFSFWQPLVQRLHQVDSILWSNVQELEVKGLFLKKKLSVRGTGERGPISLKMPIPNGLFGLFAPMKNNIAGAKTVAAAFQGGQAPALAAPMSQGYGQPQISYAPPVPQLGAPVQQPMPAQNAPGYASVPPPASGPYGVPPAPMAGPPAAPQGGGYPPRSWS